MTGPHPAARELLLLAVDNGWSAALAHGEDTGGAPFVSVQAKRADGADVRVVWHIRGHGTYRLFSCMVNVRDTSLTKAKAVLAELASDQ